MYKVVFQFMNEHGEWVDDCFSNNGAGFTWSEAMDVFNDLMCRGKDSIPIRGIRILKIN